MGKSECPDKASLSFNSVLRTTQMCQPQCPAFQGISFRDGTGRDFCKIPGSRDFPGRDLPHIFIPGFFGNCSGFFGIFLFDAIGDQFKHFSQAGKPNAFSAWLEML